MTRAALLTLPPQTAAPPTDALRVPAFLAELVRSRGIAVEGGRPLAEKHQLVQPLTVDGVDHPQREPLLLF